MSEPDLKMTGSFDITEFVCQERVGEYSGDTEYSLDGEYWCESEEEAREQYKQMHEFNDHIIF